MKKAIILTNGLLSTSNAKTAHGLIRESERFEIVGVIDEIHAGKDAGEVLDEKNPDIKQVIKPDKNNKEDLRNDLRRAIVDYLKKK